jgi:hypothetical protein
MLSAPAIHHRRDFLHHCMFGLGALSLPDLLRLQALGNEKTPAKSVIMVWLYGGPSHIDMYDLKPEAPAEYRGEFKPIQTRVPGLDICELLPRQAAIADKLAIVRNMQFQNFKQDDHSRIELQTGGFTGKPSFGAVVSRLRHEAGLPGTLPPYVSLSYPAPDANAAESERMAEDPSYAGVSHAAFTPGGPGEDNLQLARQISLEQLAERKSLLKAFEHFPGDADGKMSGHNAFIARALELITTPKARAAFDVSQEPEKLRARYGERGHYLLQARRLAEAGVPVVTVKWANSLVWDTHKDNFKIMRQLLPSYDQGVTALIEDIHERGLDQDVLVVVWGEMGRTPIVNGNGGGRDHWTNAGFSLLTGGGLRMGQVIGATTARGERPKGNPYTPQNVLAMVYRHLGIDQAKTQLVDFRGRPRDLLDDVRPIQELL